MTAIKNDLTLEQLTDLVGDASGWGERGNITFRRDIDRSRVPNRTYVSASVDICGAKITISATGVDHRAALIALLVNIEMNHREITRWHNQRLKRVREILDEHDIYYVRGEP